MHVVKMQACKLGPPPLTPFSAQRVPRHEKRRRKKSRTKACLLHDCVQSRMCIHASTRRLDVSRQSFQGAKSCFSVDADKRRSKYAAGREKLLK